MPKYWGKQIFAHGSFPEVGQKQKMEKKREERPNDGNNNGQLRIATTPRVAHAKPLGPKLGNSSIGAKFGPKYLLTIIWSWPTGPTQVIGVLKNVADSFALFLYL